MNEAPMITTCFFSASSLIRLAWSMVLERIYKEPVSSSIAVMTPEICNTLEVLPHHPQQPGHRPQGQQQLVVGQAEGGGVSQQET